MKKLSKWAVFGPSIAGVHIGAFLGPNKSIDGRNASKHHQTRKQAKPDRQRPEEPLKHHQNHKRTRNSRNSSARVGKYVKKLNFIPQNPKPLFFIFPFTFSSFSILIPLHSFTYTLSLYTHTIFRLIQNIDGCASVLRAR
jgi:hypothetical protein